MAERRLTKPGLFLLWGLVLFACFFWLPKAPIHVLSTVSTLTQLALAVLGAKAGTDPRWCERHKSLIVWLFAAVGTLGAAASYHGFDTAAKEAAADKRSIERLTQESLSNITGGDAFPYVVPQTHAGLDALPLVVWNRGKYILNGVVVTIQRARKEDYKNPLTFWTAPEINVGVLHPDQGKSLMKVFLRPDPDSGDDGIDTYHIRISAQNGTVLEVLQFRKSKYATAGFPWAYRYKVDRQTVDLEQHSSQSEPIKWQWEWSDDLGDGKPTTSAK